MDDNYEKEVNKMKAELENGIDVQIYEFVAEKGGSVSFVEIADEFGRGEYDYLITDVNLVFWSGLPRNVTTALSKLVDEKRIMMLPTSVLTYLVDGRSLKLPIAKRLPKKGYKEPHWMPVALWTVDQVRKKMAEGTMLTDPKNAAVYRDAGYDI